MFFFKAQKEEGFNQVTSKTISSTKTSKKFKKTDHRNRQKKPFEITTEEDEKKEDRRWSKHNKAFATKAQKNKWNSYQSQKRNTFADRSDVVKFSVQSNWEKLETFEFVSLNKESFSPSSDSFELLKSTGKLYKIQKGIFISFSIFQFHFQFYFILFLFFNFHFPISFLFYLYLIIFLIFILI